MRFLSEPGVEYGAVSVASPLIRRVVAPNPGAFTYHGTGTYIVGHGEVAVIDPGPDIPSHVAALLTALGGERVSHILVTHTHRDHSPAAAALKAATGAPTLGFGPHAGGAGPAVEEGADHDFVPDQELRDGDAVAGAGWTLEAVHTPGHTSNHLCFGLRDVGAFFPGDHVMGWSTTIVSPPDGDMADYRASLARLAQRGDAIYYPTHGPAITDPAAFLAGLAAHRTGREAAVLACMDAGIAEVPAMVRQIYQELDPRLHGAAGRSVLAHLIQLVDEGRAVAEGPDGAAATISARFRLL